MDNKLWGVALAVFFLMLLYITHDDYKESQKSAIAYCYNVKHRIWPDYQGIFKKECK